jgi:two-component sensor histidine kinase
VPSGIDIERRLSHEANSVVEARHALQPLQSAVDPDTFETLRLLVTELIGNSVRHATPRASEEIELSVRASRERIRVEVANSAPGFTPLPRPEDADEASGWGLHILEALSDRWGTAEDERMRVWFELVDSGAFAEYAPA